MSNCITCGGFDHQDGSTCVACGRRSSNPSATRRTALTAEQQLLIKKALQREAEHLSAYSFDLVADARRIQSTYPGDAADLETRARRLAVQSDEAIELADLMYDAKAVVITIAAPLAPNPAGGGL